MTSEREEIDYALWRSRLLLSGLRDPIARILLQDLIEHLESRIVDTRWEPREVPPTSTRIVPTKESKPKS